MKWTARTTYPRNIYCEIYTDTYTEVPSGKQTTHYRLAVFENGEGLDDDLQDTLQFAKEAAMEYGIPLDAWQQVDV